MRLDAKIILALCVLIFIFIFLCRIARDDEITASWYSEESCKREGTSGICANGEVFDDTELVCASWDWPFGTRLKVSNTKNGRSVIVTVADRGPAKRLYRQGRKIDLSRKAFSVLAPLSQGLIPISIEVVE